MTIGEALPSIFKRTYPVLEPDTQMLLAISLLRFHELDALPIGFSPERKKRLAVSGYSCLSKLLKTDPEDYGKFLETPCEDAAVELNVVSIDESIEALLHIFERTRFGFAWVESEVLGCFVSLRDLLDLYEKRIIETRMSVGEVASPIFSMPKETELKRVLQEMFDHRLRRVFVSGEKNAVTDRRIIGYVFSTARLNETSKKPRQLLDAKLADLEKTEPLQITEETGIKAAVMSMKNAGGDCLVCEKGVITPWDLVMKPFARHELKIL